MMLLEVAVAAPLEQTLTYGLRAVSEGDEEDSGPRGFVGRRVLVPLGNRKVTGYVVGIIDDPGETSFILKEVIAFQDDYPLIHDNLIPFFRWAANYYHYPLGLVIKAALPGGLAPQSHKVLRLTGRPQDLLEALPRGKPPGSSLPGRAESLPRS